MRGEPQCGREHLVVLNHLARRLEWGWWLHKCEKRKVKRLGMRSLRCPSVNGVDALGFDVQVRFRRRERQVS